MKSSFIIVGLLLASALTLYAENDIIEQAASHPRGVEQVQQPDGSYKVSKYGDHLLARAEDFLSAQHPRPWTVPKVLAWTHDATDPTTQAHLLRLLAASRDPSAALCLSDFLPSNSLDVRMAAYYGLYDYFVPSRTDVGGTEDVIRVVREWVAANKDRLQAAPRPNSRAPANIPCRAFAKLEPVRPIADYYDAQNRLDVSLADGFIRRLSPSHSSRCAG